MKRIFIFTLILILFLGVFVFDILNSTGYFRLIKEYGTERIIKKIPIVGAEDIVIPAYEDFAIVSSDDRAARREGSEKQGALYLLDLDDFSFF